MNMQEMKMWPVLLACCVLTVLSGVAAADEDPVTDQVSFQVDVEREVENDRVLAVLTVDAEDRDAARLADRVNRAMAWALERSRGEAAVRSRSGGYQTYPVYDDRKIVRWRARQELYLESADVDRLSQLVGGLQEQLQVQSLRFSVSDDRRRAVEEELVAQVLADFQGRAELIARALGAKDGYQLADVTLRTGGRDPVAPLRAETMAASRAAVAAPALEAGTSRVSVTASGSIRLLR